MDPAWLTSDQVGSSQAAVFVGPGVGPALWASWTRLMRDLKVCSQSSSQRGDGLALVCPLQVAAAHPPPRAQVLSVLTDGGGRWSVWMEKWLFTEGLSLCDEWAMRLTVLASSQTHIKPVCLCFSFSSVFVSTHSHTGKLVVCVCACVCSFSQMPGIGFSEYNENVMNENECVHLWLLWKHPAKVINDLLSLILQVTEWIFTHLE